ncbi:MAG TPA: hypothetical protein VFG18_10520 [Xanthomonadaceae bacterium]|nr:hypothetical protein [Xanthomonadaceae bacterium]
MRLATWVPGLAIAAAGLCGGYLAGHDGGNAEAARLSRDLANLRQEVAELRRAALPRATGSAAGPARPPLPAGMPRSRMAAERPPSEAEIQARARRTIAALERDYASEPLDAAWSGRSIAMVEDAIVQIATEGGPTPKSVQVDCRSRSCRIELGLADSGDLGPVIDNLLVKVAGTLPHAQLIELPAPDGKGTRVSIYAGPG